MPTAQLASWAVTLRGRPADRDRRGPAPGRCARRRPDRGRPALARCPDHRARRARRRRRGAGTVVTQLETPVRDDKFPKLGPSLLDRGQRTRVGSRGMTPRVVAIGGGKGGVGKSLVAANVGIFLATLGKRVVLVDGAFGAPNLHIFAGVPRPARSLSEAFAAGGPQLAELAVPTHVPGVKLIGGVQDPPWVAEPGPTLVRLIAEQLSQLPADWVVVDLGPGLGSPTLELFLDADISLLVAVPDPTSIELMHRFVKAAFLQAARAARARRILAQLATARAARLRGRLAEPSRDLSVGRRASGRRDRRAPRGDPRLRTAPGDQLARSKSDMELGRAVASAARRGSAHRSATSVTSSTTWRCGRRPGGGARSSSSIPRPATRSATSASLAA